MNTEQLEKLDLLSTNELLELLGTELQRNRLDAKDSDAPEVAGKKALQTYSRTFQDRICQSPTIQKFLQSEKTFKRVEIIAAIADVISGFLTGVSLATVSVLIAREGISSYCDN